MTRRLDPTKVRAFRRAPGASPAPVVATGPGYVLHFGQVAFVATVHRVGCTCPSKDPERAALYTTTWAHIQAEPIVARFRGLAWRIRRAECASTLT